MTVDITKAFGHLVRLSDHRGLFEHAEGTVRRLEHGYCTDDNARLLVVASREDDAGVPGQLGRLALAFVCDAQDSDGRFRNRMNAQGRWTDQASTDDCWGRSVWALGSAAATHPSSAVRAEALACYDRGVRQRSPHARSMAFAALGAADLVLSGRADRPSRALLEDAVSMIGPGLSDAWRWPEPRLRYANAALAEAVIAAGAALGDDRTVERGLAMLGWLLDIETQNGHLSVTGVEGRGAGENDQQFDQQAIEVGTISDACWRAHQVTGDPAWLAGIAAGFAWFNGDNDSGVVMYDAETGGGFDGLQRTDANLNQGAESTLALVSTLQRAEHLAISR